MEILSKLDRYNIKIKNEDNFKISNPKEKFNFYSHFISGIFALIGLSFLLYKSSNNFSTKFWIYVYGFSVVFVFFASAFWHSRKKNEKHYDWATKLDEIAIFFAIAGHYSILSYIFLSNWVSSVSLCFEWLLVIVGTVFKIRFENIKRWITATIYLFMGSISFFSIKQLIISMPNWAFILFILGGILVSAGAVLFVLMKPRKFHEIFHVLVSSALSLFYIIIIVNINFLGAI